MKILVAVPVYISTELHVEFTETTVNSLQTHHDKEILLIENFCAPEYKERLAKLGEVFPNPKGNSVPTSWNLGIKAGIERHADYILIPNNDLIFHPQCLDNLVTFAEEHKEFILWSAAEHTDMRTLNQAVVERSFDEHPHFSCFMISPNTVKMLQAKEAGTTEPYPGIFDENLRTAYFEDGDMHQRILRAGFKAGKTASALFYHFGSRTIKLDEKLSRLNRNTYELNRAYFGSKWGFDPHGKVIENDDPIRFKYRGPFQAGL